MRWGLQGQRDLRGLWVRRAQRVQRVRKGTKAHRAFKALPGLRALLGRWELREPRAIPDQLGRRGLQESPELPVRRDL